MARFITSYLLAQRLHPAIALQVSILIKKYRKRYYDLFSHTDADINRGDLTPFIMGTLQFIEQATLFTHRTLKHKYQNYQKAQSQLLQTPDLPIKNKTAAAICDILLQAATFSDIGVSIKEIRETLGISENTVYNHLKKIPEEHLQINKEIRPYRYQLRL